MTPFFVEPGRPPGSSGRPAHGWSTTVVAHQLKRLFRDMLRYGRDVIKGTEDFKILLIPAAGHF